MFMLVGAQLSARGDEPLGVDELLLGHSLPGSSVALENGFPMDFNWLLSFCLTHTHTDRVKHDRWHTEHARRTGEEVAVSASDTNMTEITAPELRSATPIRVALRDRRYQTRAGDIHIPGRAHTLLGRAVTSFGLGSTGAQISPATLPH